VVEEAVRLAFPSLLLICRLCLLISYPLSGAKNGNDEDAAGEENDAATMAGSSKNHGKKGRLALPQPAILMGVAR
jgi:hypothetical protein